VIIVGLKSGGHDPSIAILKDGELVFAAEEERFTRKKHAHGQIPINALKSGLKSINVPAELVNYWVIHHAHPLKLIYRTAVPYLMKPPKNILELRFAVIQIRDEINYFWSWYNKKTPVQKLFQELGLKNPNIIFLEHHVAHSLSATLFQDVSEGLSISLDGMGDGSSLMVGTFSNKISQTSKLQKIILCSQQYNFKKFFQIRMRFDPRFSLGLAYSEFTKFLGFEPNDAEYKVMGLASYGVPKYNLKKVFGFDKGIPKRKLASYVYWKPKSTSLADFLGIEKRTPESDWSQEHANLASSVQFELEQSMLSFSHQQLNKQQKVNLVLSGGVALNVKMNMNLREKLNLNSFFVQPVSSDAGLALGCAGYMYKKLTGLNPKPLKSLHLGPDITAYSLAPIELNQKVTIEKFQNWEDLCKIVAKEISSGAVVAWMQGRMEFGPRSLGARSILADPRKLENRDHVNSKIKFREMFRPFCPSMLKSDFIKYVEEGSKWELSNSLPFMIEAFRVNDKATAEIPAVVHIDKTIRPQILDESSDYLSEQPYLMLLKAFKNITGIGVLLNTSLNRRGEPIACKPLEGLEIFLDTHLDLLVIGKNIIRKNKSETFRLSN
jgi:carbamoyltransferase